MAIARSLDTKPSDENEEARLTNSISTGTSRTHNHGITILMEGLSMTGGQGAEAHSQRRHAHYKPEILLEEDVVCTCVPGTGLSVIRVSEDSKDP
jgi:hypothetical protein